MHASQQSRLQAVGLKAADIPPAFLLIVFSGLALCMPPQTDTWWHLRAGREMVTAGRFLTTDQFAYTILGSPLHYDHHWLAQVVFFGLHRLGGPFLLAVFSAGCVLAAVVGAWRLARGSAEARFTWLIVLLVGTPSAWSIRPQVISLVMFVLACHLVLSDRKRDVWLPLVCLVWSNLHAVAITGPVIAGCAVVEALLWSRERVVRSLIIFAACLAAPLATPLGWDYWPRILELVRLARAVQLQEFRSAFEMAQLPFWALVGVFAFLATRGLLHGVGERATRLLAIIAAVFAVAGALSVRNIPLFVLAAAPASSRLWRMPVRPRVQKLAPAGTAVLVAAFIVATFGTVAYAWRDRGAHLGWVPIRPDAITAVRECEGPLFNSFSDGATLMWFVPDRHVFVDIRGVEVFPAALLLKSRDADLFGRYEGLFAEFGIRCAVVANGSVMAEQLSTNPRMDQRFADEQWQVFATTRP